MIRKLILFLAGFVLLVIIFITTFFAGALYDTTQKTEVNLTFFQLNNRSDMRPGEPELLTQIPPEKILHILIQRYVGEYFTVLPIPGYIQQRTGNDSLIAVLSNHKTNDVFTNWKDKIAPQLEEMERQGFLQLVQVTDILGYGDYYQVKYTTLTWIRPNDMNQTPVIKDGTMYLKISGDLGILPSWVKEENKIHNILLNKNEDPLKAFDIWIDEVRLQ